MAKKPIVEVDEDMLRSTMMGDVPVMRKQQPQEKSGSEQEQEQEDGGGAALDNAPARRGPYRKRRREDTPYAETFFVQDNCRSRVTVYLNRDTHEKLKALVASAAPDITIASYLNNIVNNHFEVYGEEIEDIYRSAMEKQFKKK